MIVGIGKGGCPNIEQYCGLKADFPQPPMLNVSGTHGVIVMEKPVCWPP